MKIERIEIKNYKNFEDQIIKIGSKKWNIILGKNGTGKTNLIKAIRKILDIDYRKREFQINDSYNSNKKEISIKIIFNFNKLENYMYAKLIEYVYQENGNYFFQIESKSIFSYENDSYETTLLFGKDDIKEINPSHINDFDRVINFIYFEPNFNFNKSFSSYIKGKKRNLEEANKKVSRELLCELREFKKKYKDDEIIKEMSNEINNKINNTNLSHIFSDENIYFGPDIPEDTSLINKMKMNYEKTNDQNSVSVETLGDGKEKLVTYTLKYLSGIRNNGNNVDLDKNCIFLIEEPENNLYSNLQEQFLKYIEEIGKGFSQVIITTHSPLIINLKKVNKFMRLAEKIFYCDLDNEKIDYLFNERIAKGLFYKNVLLVEGESEMVFYEWLKQNYEQIEDYIIKNEIYIIPVLGINFKPYFDLYKKLGINVSIKTDNDFSDKKGGYFGFKRMIEYLDNDSIIKQNIREELTQLTKSTLMTNKNIEHKENHVKKIVEYFKEENIFFQKHHKSFEGDISDFFAIPHKPKNKQKDLFSFLKERERIDIKDKENSNILEPLLSFKKINE